MLDAEDARASDAESLAPLLQGLRSANIDTRRVAVRALGRIERRENLAALEPMLTDPSPGVRAEALNAVAQIAKADGPNGPADTDARIRVWMGVSGLIRGLTASETDPVVRGVMARTLGRLPYPTEEVARSVTASIASLLDGVPTDGALGKEPWFGVAHGTDALLRRFPNLRTAPGVLRVARVPLAANDGSASDSSWSRETNVILAAIRGRVLGAAVGSPNGVDDSTARDLGARFLGDFGDADAQVRRQVVALVAIAPALDDSARARVVRTALGDPSPSVRVEGVHAYARTRGARCAPLITATNDSSGHVALAAIDALAAPCDPAGAAVARLSQLVRALPRGVRRRVATRGSWHLGAHAAVALSRIAPDSARAMLPKLVSHPVWQVRMYAARTAGPLVDTATLRRLSRDRSDNVRDAAIVALSELVRPSTGGPRPAIERTAAIDSIVASELARPDYQLVLDAAKALEGAHPSPRLGELLLATLDRVTAEHRDTSRDPRMELLARIEALSAIGNASRVRPYLEDYDPAIAERAARVLRSWGVNDVVVAPRRATPIPVSLAALAPLRNARVRVTMAPESGGGSFDLQLFVDEAPATISRFVTLAQRGYYNGLTFHRVATNFVIQGGSPGANEYVGAEVYMRDEVGLRSHERGTLGISTRGRDTGDAQIFVNVIDNWRLDHDYTVFAEVIRGMNVVDAILEGDVIANIEILGPR